MKRVILHDEAKAELREAMLWYEAQCPGLGEDFLAEFEAQLDAVETHPLTLPPLAGTPYRRAIFRRFPYTLPFGEWPDARWILAVAHTARRPQYWEKRKPMAAKKKKPLRPRKTS